VEDRGGPEPILKLAEQKVIRKARFKVRFFCKTTKYVSKMSYFTLKSSKIISFWGSDPRVSSGPVI